MNECKKDTYSVPIKAMSILLQARKINSKNNSILGGDMCFMLNYSPQMHK